VAHGRRRPRWRKQPAAADRRPRRADLIGPARDCGPAPRGTRRTMFDTPPMLDCAGRRLALDRPRVMGIVNVTPDSFSDGGAHFDPEAAVAHGLALAEAGADILDIGGESTRSGAGEVPVEEELRRTIPVI